MHSFVGAKEDASGCAGLEDIRSCPEEVVAVEVTDTWLGVVMAEVAKNDKPGDPTVGALATSLAAMVRTDEF